MRIGHNIVALTAYDTLNATNDSLQKTISQLSSGLRINSAADDAAGLAISEKMRAQISGLDRAAANAEDGISLLQTAEGGLGQIHSILQRMRELSVEAANDTFTALDRSYIQDEVDELKEEINHIAATTQFNTKNLLDGSCGAVWSSDSLSTVATIRGALTGRDQFGQKISAERNYRIELTADPGQAQVQKSQIFTSFLGNDAAVLPANSSTAAPVVPAVPVAPTHFDYTYSVSSGPINITEDGTYKISGAGAATTNAITVAAGVTATIVLDNVNINGRYASALNMKGASVNLYLSGTNTLKSAGYAATLATTGGTLVIRDSGAGTGTLNVTQDEEAAAIGGGAGVLGADGEDGGTVQIISGTINAQGGFRSAAIGGGSGGYGGSGKGGDGGTVIISGGTVNAVGGQHGAGIGGGSSNTITASPSSGGTILITGGTVNATGGRSGGSAIGGSLHGNGGTITITGGTVNATGGDSAGVTGSAGIGANGKDGGNITITGGTVTANAVGAGIGGGSSGTITISGGTVTATGENRGAGIGAGEVAANVTNNVTVAITGGTVTATGGNQGAGIGGGRNGDGGTITISGGAVTATGGQYAAGIGGGDHGDGGIITISDATVTAIGGMMGAGIGGGDYGKSGTIRISTGTDTNVVTATRGTGGTGLQEDVGHGDHVTEESDVITVVEDEDEEEESSTETREVSIDAGRVQLSELAQFYDATGNFLLTDPQDLAIIQGDGQQAKITLYQSDTLNDVVEKINNAISLSLGQKKYVDKADKFCTLADGTEGTSEAVAQLRAVYSDELYKVDNNGKYVLDSDGNKILATEEERFLGYESSSTLLVRSAVAGKAGELTFSASEAVLNALGLNTIQKARENQFTANIYDAHTGTAIASGVKATGNQLRGVIHENVDVTFDAMAGITAAWNDGAKRYTFTSGKYTTYLHLSDNSMAFQIGANEGDQLFVSIGNMSTDALGITGVNVASREGAARAVTLIDGAIDRASSQRARIGAYQNRLEHTITNLTITSENLTAAESRIRDTDMAKAMMQFVKTQILTQTGTAMLAQANQLPQAVLSLVR